MDRLASAACECGRFRIRQDSYNAAGERARDTAIAPGVRAGRLTPIDPRTCIGHVHLKVADLERALSFYRGVLGFQVTQRYGRQAAFVSAGGYHHYIGLNTWQSNGASPPPAEATGLCRLAILCPSRGALGGCPTTVDELRYFIGGRQRSRCERSIVPARPGQKRDRIVLGQAAK
jgi:catechol-2,3-dioxygenase